MRKKEFLFSRFSHIINTKCIISQFIWEERCDNGLSNHIWYAFIYVKDKWEYRKMAAARCCLSLMKISIYLYVISLINLRVQLLQ